MTDDQLALPGLEPAKRGDGPMAKAADLTLTELVRVGRIEKRHAALCQLVRSLAQAIDGGAGRGRASAVAMAAAQLRETMLVLDPPPEPGDAGAEGRDRLAKFMAQLEAAANAGDEVPTE